ncbi:MAG: hypothetical protein ABIK26_01595 [Candidatus Omnitrophota bacterium]
MSKRQVGLYLGVKSVGVVVVERKKLVSLCELDLSSLEEEARLESLNEEIRWEALINKALREVEAKEEDIYLSIADRDFIFRSLEVPLMSKKEIALSLIYEIEKYIPFKIEELRWDYNYAHVPGKKMINVSFVGIREANYKKIQDLFSHLDLHVCSYEPAAMSLVRVLKSLKSFSKLKNFAVLDFTEHEGYLTYFYHNLPAFNRYFIIPKKEEIVDMDKFIEPIRLSFQYLKREFSTYEVDKIILVANSPDENLARLLKEELQTEVELITASFLSGKENSTVESIKALGAAGINYYPYKFKPILRTTEIQMEEAKKFPLHTKKLNFLLGLGLLAFISCFAFTMNKLFIEESVVKEADNALVAPASLEGLSREEIKNAIGKKEAEFNHLSESVVSLKKISPLLEKFASLLPQGAWFDRLDLSYDLKRNKCGSILRGCVFLDDEYGEKVEINKFVSSLKGNELMATYFLNIKLTHIAEVKIKGFRVTSFVVDLE